MKIVMRMRTTAVMMGKVTMMIQMVIKRRVMRMETMMTKIRTDEDDDDSGNGGADCKTDIDM